MIINTMLPRLKASPMRQASLGLTTALLLGIGAAGAHASEVLPSANITFSESVIFTSGLVGYYPFSLTTNENIIGERASAHSNTFSTPNLKSYTGLTSGGGGSNATGNYATAYSSITSEPGSLSYVSAGSTTDYKYYFEYQGPNASFFINIAGLAEAFGGSDSLSTAGANMALSLFRVEDNYLLGQDTFRYRCSEGSPCYEVDALGHSAGNASSRNLVVESYIQSNHAYMLDLRVGTSAATNMGGSAYINGFVDPFISISGMNVDPDLYSLVLSEGVTNVRGRAVPTGGVPEPGTWMLMISGFGAAGSMIRRRKALAA